MSLPSAVTCSKAVRRPSAVVVHHGIQLLPAGRYACLWLQSGPYFLFSYRDRCLIVLLLITAIPIRRSPQTCFSASTLMYVQIVKDRGPSRLISHFQGEAMTSIAPTQRMQIRKPRCELIMIPSCLTSLV